MKATLFALAALIAGIAVGIGMNRREFSREIVPVDILLVKGPATGAAPEKIGPKVTIVNSARHDFGTMDRNAHGSHAFIVRNDGDAPLTLATGQPSCSVCIKVFSVVKEKLMPGERTEVNIEWDVKTSDAEFEQSGPLNTNDPNRPSVHLSIRGHVLDSVRIDRPDVHFHDLLQTDTTSGSVNIYSFKDPDLKIEKHDFSNPTLARFFDVSFAPLSADDLAREPNAKGGLKMQIQVLPGLPHGDFSESYTIATNQNPEPLTVRVIGNIASDIWLMGPNVVRDKSLVGLGAIAQKDGKKHTVFLIVKGPHRDETKVEIKSVEPTREFSAKLGEPIHDSAKTIRYPVTIEVPAGATPVTRMEGSYAIIHVATTHPDIKEMDIKVRYVVKE
jgi:Protein of unknown function (DUF1573)